MAVVETKNLLFCVPGGPTNIVPVNAAEPFVTIIEVSPKVSILEVSPEYGIIDI